MSAAALLDNPLDRSNASLLTRFFVGLLVILLAGGIGAGGILGGLALAPLLVEAIAGADPSPPVLATIYTLAIFVPIGIAAVVAVLLVPGSALSPGRHPLGWTLVGLAIGGAGLVMSASLAGFAGTIERVPSPNTPVLLLLAGAGVTLFQTGAEELLLRGLAQPALARIWGQWPALIGAALLFMALHLIGAERTQIEVLNLFLAGLLFGTLALRTGGVVASIAAHWAWNFAETLLLGLSPNPGLGEFGSLIDLDMHGAAIWGGSDHGLNGSIAVSLVLIALTLPLLLWQLAESWGARTPAVSDAPVAPTVFDPQAGTTNPHAWLLGEDKADNTIS